MDKESLKKILLDQNYIKAEEFEKAVAYEDSGKGTSIEYLIGEGLVNRSTLGQAIAEHLGVGYIDLDERSPSNEDLQRIPEDFAKSNRIVFLKETSKGVTVASDSTDTKKVADLLKTVFPGKKITVMYTFKESLDSVLSHYQKELNTRFSEIIKREKRIAPELFEEILRDAISFRASDIHLEPQVDKTYIRFRIDGMLQLAGTISREFYESLLNRIKIEANLRTDEHFAPQDGAIRFVDREITVDLRVSIVPTLDGEKVVIRILAEYVKDLNFSDLGFNEKHILQIDAAVKKPFGMIIVSGPTGSGKTTTLYSLIKKINRPEVNVTTIEDPVEYRMVGASQIQVNPKTNLTFSKGLRAIVRQDPNIILVGEIRDTETAETAINAALTGHLLLSTFHANDAATTIPRLLDMEVEPFLLSSTLELLVAQRLVRKICESCRYSYEDKIEKMTLYKGKGCSVCNFTGYKGRTSIVEIIEVGPELKELIHSKPSSQDIWKLARANGANSLFEDGMEKAKLGITTIDEVLRVAPKDVS